MAAGKYTHPNSRQYMQDLKKGILERVYLFLGPEDAEKDKYVQYIAEIIAKKNGRKPEIQRFHADSDELLAAVATVTTEDMFASHKMAVLLNIDAMPARKREQQFLVEMIEQVPDSTTLILTAGATKEPAFIPAALRKKMQVVMFWHYFENELHTYIVQFFKKEGRDIEPAAVKKIVSLLGRDLRKIDNALYKIKSGIDEPTISEQIVERVVVDERDVSVFEFIDALFSKKKSSLSLLKKVLHEGMHELAVLVFIQREAELLERFFAMRSSGVSQGDALQQLKLPVKKVNQFVTYTNNFTEEEVQQLFIAIYHTEYQLKNYQVSKSFIGNPLVELITSVVYVPVKKNG
jgi:DNA polymerase III delta subunit